ncbi:unnamed protein product [Ambrosiozyma monospora]|uniref:Unnamed protein product n=1 Tax=Ambrosiozyma monospora TaxID=43982 RepID=A0ACB5T682_AMBMO|nr:unnamed protein product [Ambrosiozyma monospora]
MERSQTSPDSPPQAELFANVNVRVRFPPARNTSNNPHYIQTGERPTTGVAAVSGKGKDLYKLPVFELFGYSIDSNITHDDRFFNLKLDTKMSMNHVIVALNKWQSNVGTEIESPDPSLHRMYKRYYHIYNNIYRFTISQFLQFFYHYRDFIGLSFWDKKCGCLYGKLQSEDGEPCRNKLHLAYDSTMKMFFIFRMGDSHNSHNHNQQNIDALHQHAYKLIHKRKAGKKTSDVPPKCSKHGSSGNFFPALFFILTPVGIPEDSNFHYEFIQYDHWENIIDVLPHISNHPPQQLAIQSFYVVYIQVFNPTHDVSHGNDIEPTSSQNKRVAMLRFATGPEASGNFIVLVNGEWSSGNFRNFQCLDADDQNHQLSQASTMNFRPVSNNCSYQHLQHHASPSSFAFEYIQAGSSSLIFHIHKQQLI